MHLVQEGGGDWFAAMLADRVRCRCADMRCTMGPLIHKGGVDKVCCVSLCGSRDACDDEPSDGRAELGSRQ
jgi:hypothetical protein